MNDSWNIGGEGGNSFGFDRVGDSVSGKVLQLAEVQQTDMETGKPAFWEDGRPKMMYRVTLATALRDPADPADNGERSVYLRGSKKSESRSSLAAVLDAVRQATGGTSLQPNGTLTLTYTGDGEPSRRGYNAPKQYAAQYQAPAMELGGGAPVQQQPAYQAPPVQQAAPAPAVPATPTGPSREQIAAVIAAGVDPKSVWPNYQG